MKIKSDVLYRNDLVWKMIPVPFFVIKQHKLEHEWLKIHFFTVTKNQKCFVIISLVSNYM